ncbi:ribonuclease-like 3 [Notolabrus celidotus]|uniref:ribonuclease-like 3 n=1 Tax=Notolabrus celidotus TaxID=1203425 RepID=UPI0014908332|nr:ribonuclease-like 3 [Notolabrus celidotus]XP_034546418.1 ribonuclease-like 3 [Notolabrus celidotus]XP_034546419.1 ribonuclease-like 3 [Notolabrus celidotus]XP_034546420.1 ribonuclease-like 3 [Notolabrus celidotus]
MKILLILSMLLATVLCVNEGYRKFINQHVKGDMSTTRCNSEILSRSISKTNSNECKETNTFIRATTNTIKSICERAGEPYGDLTKSLQPFSIVVCTLRNQGARHPRCEYRGQDRTRRIAIRCEGGLPVHFDRDIVYFEN